MLGAQCHFNAASFRYVKRTKIIYRMSLIRLENNSFEKKKERTLCQS